jgi:hypothetical protein
MISSLQARLKEFEGFSLQWKMMEKLLPLTYVLSRDDIISAKGKAVLGSKNDIVMKW